MKDRLGKMRGKAFAVPFVVGIAMLCVLGLAMAPMFTATPKNAPMAIVNLDEGAMLPNGTQMNAGALIAQKVTGSAAQVGEGGEAPIAWTQVESSAALDGAMADGVYYGAIVIPADFTQRQMSGQAGEKPSVDVLLNLAKSPMLAQTMQASLVALLSQAGIQANVETMGEMPAGSTGPLAGMMSVQFMVMPLFMMSLIMGIAGSVLLWPRGASRAKRGRAALVQLGYCAVASFVAAVCAYGLVAWVGGVAVDAVAILFLWLAGFCVMLVTIGLCDIVMPLGVLVMLCVFALGMSTAVLPAPMLPAFWADWVLPWAPQNYIGEGLRNIIYLGGGAFDAGVMPLLVWGFAGAAALCAALVPAGSRETRARTDIGDVA